MVPFFAVKEQIDDNGLLDYARCIKDLKGIEVLTAAPYERLEYVGGILDKLPVEIELFGGVAVGDDKNPPYIFANGSDYSYDGTILVFYSGEELFFQTNRMFGWKPIGYPLKVTKADGPLIYEIDGQSAYDVYNRYLHIKKGENFFYDALEFPWEVRLDANTAVLRHAKSVNPDGSIVMSSRIPEDCEIRMTYGDPRRIIEHTKQTTLTVRDFAPEVVYIVNCMGRKLFWQDKEDVEVTMISKHMQTTGFSALGEIMRYNGRTLLNNLSIVTVAMREGDKGELVELDLEDFERNTNMPVTARLAIFINTISDELMEKNRELNKMLYRASHDALTGLLNRGAIERIIYDSDEDGDNPDWHLIMFDVDDFKQINDQKGHAEGDVILKRIAKCLAEYVAFIPGAEVGRWGGEEFMIFLSGQTDDQAKEMAEKIHTMVSEGAEGEKPITISVGVTAHRRDESAMQTITRVDELMYRAKNAGKDRVCSDTV